MTAHAMLKSTRWARGCAAAQTWHKEQRQGEGRCAGISMVTAHTMLESSPRVGGCTAARIWHKGQCEGGKQGPGNQHVDTARTSFSTAAIFNTSVTMASNWLSAPLCATLHCNRVSLNYYERNGSPMQPRLPPRAVKHTNRIHFTLCSLCHLRKESCVPLPPRQRYRPTTQHFCVTPLAYLATLIRVPARPSNASPHHFRRTTPAYLATCGDSVTARTCGCMAMSWCRLGESPLCSMTATWEGRP